MPQDLTVCVYYLNALQVFHIVFPFFKGRGVFPVNDYLGSLKDRSGLRAVYAFKTDEQGIPPGKDFRDIVAFFISVLSQCYLFKAEKMGGLSGKGFYLYKTFQPERSPDKAQGETR
jgi:hypothetical protein